MGKPRLSGPDYVLLAADEARKHGAPYADIFYQAVWAAILTAPGGGLDVMDVTAARELRNYEQTPVAILGLAADLAARARDMRAILEIVQCGGALLAKWPSIMVGTVTGHPELRWRYGESLDLHPPPAPPAGWYADPGFGHELRYFDAHVWTDQVSDAGVVTASPLPRDQPSDGADAVASD